MAKLTLPPATNAQQALAQMNLLLANGMVDLALERAKQFPSIQAGLPEELRLKLNPPPTKNPLAAKVKEVATLAQQMEEDANLQLSLWLSNFITQDKDMLELKRKVEILSPRDEPVLIHGETGTGKEIIAHALHGARNVDRFVPINCAGMPEHLIESELFGHVRGAFTGADYNKTGLLQEAQDGTIFLDEIGDLNINVQAKLLRALQDRRIRKVGSNTQESINCRVVAASHHHLPSLIKLGKFRQDLYARLSMFELVTKPIRYRLEDIPLIVKALDPDSKFPVAAVKWDRIDLGENYRSMQRIVKRYLVLGELPIERLTSDETFIAALEEIVKHDK